MELETISECWFWIYNFSFQKYSFGSRISTDVFWIWMPIFLLLKYKKETTNAYMLFNLTVHPTAVIQFFNANNFSISKITHFNAIHRCTIVMRRIFVSKIWSVVKNYEQNWNSLLSILMKLIERPKNIIFWLIHVHLHLKTVIVENNNKLFTLYWPMAWNTEIDATLIEQSNLYCNCQSDNRIKSMSQI